jgi:hypothetical protein
LNDCRGAAGEMLLVVVLQDGDRVVLQGMNASICFRLIMKEPFGHCRANCGTVLTHSRQETRITSQTLVQEIAERQRPWRHPF